MNFNSLLANKDRIYQPFMKDTDFSTAFRVGIAVILPISLGIFFDELEIGLAICFGAFWCSPADVSGSFKHKKLGILLSALLVTIISFIGGYLHFDNWYYFPFIGLITFPIAYISIYGFRASLISFSGLLAFVLSFAFTPQELTIYENSLFIGLGGLWYLLLATIWYRIRPHNQTEKLLTNTFQLTADFLHNRGKLIHFGNNRKELQDQLQQQQAELMELHETLREILILSRQSSGRSTYKGKRLLIFIQLIEILETAIAHPVNYEKMDVFFKAHQEILNNLQTLIFEMAIQLHVLAEGGKSISQFLDNKKLNNYLKKAKDHADELKEKGTDYESYIMLRNFIDYQEAQYEKLRKIKWLLGNPDLSSIDTPKREDLKRFILPQDYSPKLLLRNLSAQSNIFKHSIRLSTIMMLGYLCGSIFDFQNPYWILLTIIVILRPNYGLTKHRAKDRMIGTLLGGLIAFPLIIIVSDVYVLGALGLLSLVFAFSLIQKNFAVSAIFVTLSVVFVYAIIEDNIIDVILFRVIDTLIGAGLSFLGTWLLWPAWTYKEIHENIRNSVAANKDFLQEIALFYQKKGSIPTTLKIARKQAFIETSNLNSAFQRMAQEPESKQINLDGTYELVELNHNFLSSLSSLNIYIQNNPTTKASDMFKAVIAKIDDNLNKILQQLDGQKIASQKNNNSFVNNAFFKEQLQLFYRQEINYKETEDKMLVRNYQEAQLIWEQLHWLNALSQSILKKIGQIKLPTFTPIPIVSKPNQ